MTLDLGPSPKRQDQQYTKKSFLVEPKEDGIRLDKLLAERLTSISRTRVKSLIQEGYVTVDGQRVLLPKKKVKSGQRLFVQIPPPEPIELIPQDIPIEICYQDKDILVVNKPPGLVVHPGAGKKDGTLVNALLSLCKDLSSVGGKLRPGIVHRLDKDTSGLMIIAKSDRAHMELVGMFQERRLTKRYLALTKGIFPDVEGRIDLPIGRHPVSRIKMAVNFKDGKDAVTIFRVRERLKVCQLVELTILTGRTHQIRVHLSHLGHPILGDTTYGGPREITVNGKRLVFERQMLHAYYLSFIHPFLKRKVELEAPMPQDMKRAYDTLRKLA